MADSRVPNVRSSPPTVDSLRCCTDNNTHTHRKHVVARREKGGCLPLRGGWRCCAGDNSTNERDEERQGRWS